MRVGIIALQHESNTFLARPTTWTDFQADALLTGQAIRDAYADSHHEVGGFFAGLEEAGFEAVPLLLALATPGGPIEHATAERLLAEMFEQLAAAGELDGLLVAPHGAAVTDHERDFDGHWLTLLRQRVGPDLPLIGTLDPHAHISRRMIEATNAIIAYRSNPHIDQRDTGAQAARLMARTLRGEVTPVQAAAWPKVAISIDCQHTPAAPCTELYQRADAGLEQDRVLANSVVLGFPYGDVEDLGSAFIVVADGDEQVAHDQAHWLARWLYANRQKFACALPSVDEAIEQARQASADAKPICLLDAGDNVGGGSPGDGTVLAHALHQRALHERQVLEAFVCLNDPEAARQAQQAGVNITLELAMGGKTDDRHGPPLVAEVTVQGLYDGTFSDTTPAHGGRTRYEMGLTAVVRTRTGLTVMLTSRRTPPFSLGIFGACGLDPEQFRVLVAKGVNGPIAAYQAVCERFIRVNTPGVTCADMRQLTFQHRPRPLYPFED